MGRHINQNFGCVYEHYEDDSYGSYRLSGVCVHQSGGDDAYVKNLKIEVEFDGWWAELKNMPANIIHKYEERLLSRWLEEQR